MNCHVCLVEKNSDAKEVYTSSIGVSKEYPAILKLEVRSDDPNEPDRELRVCHTCYHKLMALPGAGRGFVTEEGLNTVGCQTPFGRLPELES